nr:DNA-deoxyinosine glycosylase [Reinekea sp. G2M2-21]
MIQSFEPEAKSGARVLVLGSIPGVASLQAVQYYAHPRNAFWPIMGAYFQFNPTLAYETRLAQLNRHQVALWDVLQRCERPGSLDSEIRTQTIQVNPIADWLQSHPEVALILLNGGTAGREFNKHFSGISTQGEVSVLTLPSTSPAYAAMPFQKKLQRWHAALDLVYRH